MTRERVINLTDTFETAISNEDYEQGMETLEKIDEQYHTLSVEEKTRYRRAIRALEHNSTTDEAAEVILHSFAEQHGLTQLARGSFMLLGSACVSAPKTTSQDDLAAGIRRLQRQERAYDEHTQEASSLINEYNLAASLEFIDIRLPEEHLFREESLEVGLVVRNVGDEPATGAVIRISSDMEIGDELIELGEIEPGVSRSVSFDATPDQTGPTTIDIRSTHSSGSEITTSITLEIHDMSTMFTVISDLIDDLKWKIEQEDKIGRGLEHSVFGKLRNVDSQIARAVRLAERERFEEVNNALLAASRQLGGFVNSFERRTAVGRNRLSPPLRYEVTRHAEDTIEAIAVTRHSLR